MKKWIFSCIVLVLFIALFVNKFQTIQAAYRGLIGKQDISLWNGTTTKTFSRTTTGGYTLTLNDLDWVGVDVLHEYGGSVNRNSTTISSALNSISAASPVQLWFSPGNWSITSGLTFGINNAIYAPSGVTFTLSTGVTIWACGPMKIGNYPVFDCSASGSTVILLNRALNGFISGEWWSGANTGYGIGKIPDGTHELDVDNFGSKNIISDNISTSNLSATGGSAILTSASLTSGTITNFISTNATISGLTVNSPHLKTGRINLTSSETLSETTTWNKFISNTGAESEVTGTFVSSTGYENVVVQLTNGNYDISLKFYSGDVILGMPDFNPSLDYIHLSGTTMQHQITLISAGISTWALSGISGSPSVKQY